VLHGPYETWTWRPDGTAVTRTLTDDQSERLKPYSEAHRRLKQLVAELERLSLELIKQAEDIDLGYPANVGDRQAKAGTRHGDPCPDAGQRVLSLTLQLEQPLPAGTLSRPAPVSARWALL